MYNPRIQKKRVLFDDRTFPPGQLMPWEEMSEAVRELTRLSEQTQRQLEIVRKFLGLDTWSIEPEPVEEDGAWNPNIEHPVP